MSSREVIQSYYKANQLLKKVEFGECQLDRRENLRILFHISLHIVVCVYTEAANLYSRAVGGCVQRHLCLVD